MYFKWLRKRNVRIEYFTPVFAVLWKAQIKAQNQISGFLLNTSSHSKEYEGFKDKLGLNST